MKKYKQSTRRLGIPVVGYDDCIWPELELKKYQIIESMLLAGLRGAVNCVFDEGDMTLRRKDDGKFGVIMSATGCSPSCTGTVGGAYFEAPSSVEWEGLEDGSSYFLYLRGSQETFEKPSEVRPVASTRRMDDGVSVLVAKVNLGGDVPSLERDPEGKVSARDLAAHVLDKENPHGETLVQDKLLVRGRLELDPGAVVGIGLAGLTAGAVAESLSKTSRVLDFVTGGETGTVLDAGGRVLFASVSRVSSGPARGSSVVGEVSVGYFGTDLSAVDESKLVVRNSGAAGIPMRAMVLVG